MESHDALVLIAELAVAIAGFSSIVVALDSRAVRVWSPFRRHNLRVLLQVSALTIFLALFPLIFQRVVADPVGWKWALAVYGAVHAIDISSFIWRIPEDLPTANRVLLFVGLTAAVASLVVAYLGSPLVAEVFYLCSLVGHLSIAAMGFAFLVMGEATEAAERKNLPTALEAPSCAHS
jgi:hypothetical protein